MQTSFIEQAELMRLPPWLSPDQLNIVDPVCVLVLMPAFDMCLFPLYAHRPFNDAYPTAFDNTDVVRLRRVRVHLSPTLRISIGFMFASLAMVFAGN